MIKSHLIDFNKNECVMCEEFGTHKVDANYKDGVEQEILCDNCFRINWEIEKRKQKG